MAYTINGYEPKVFMCRLTVPGLASGEQKAVKLEGKKLMESPVSASLPALSLLVQNYSFGAVTVILNEDELNSFDVPAGAVFPFSGYPVTSITVKSITPAVTITEGEVSIVLFNDMAETLRFYECKKRGLVPYV
jgi:hypothetical protein